MQTGSDFLLSAVSPWRPVGQHQPPRPTMQGRNGAEGQKVPLGYDSPEKLKQTFTFRAEGFLLHLSSELLILLNV